MFIHNPRSLVWASLIAVSVIAPIAAISPEAALDNAEKLISVAFPDDASSREVLTEEVLKKITEYSKTVTALSVEEFGHIVNELIRKRQNKLSEEFAEILSRDPELAEAILLSAQKKASEVNNKRKSSPVDQPAAKKAKQEILCPICLENCQNPYLLHDTKDGNHSLCFDCAKSLFSTHVTPNKIVHVVDGHRLEEDDGKVNCGCAKCTPQCPICRHQLVKDVLKKDLKINN